MDAVETLRELGDPDLVVGVETVDDLFDGGEGHGSEAVGLRPPYSLIIHRSPGGCQPLGFSSRHGAA